MSPRFPCHAAPGYFRGIEITVQLHIRLFLARKFVYLDAHSTAKRQALRLLGGHTVDIAGGVL